VRYAGEAKLQLETGLAVQNSIGQKVGLKAHEYQEDPVVLREKVQLLADMIRASKK